MIESRKAVTGYAFNFQRFIVFLVVFYFTSWKKQSDFNISVPLYLEIVSILSNRMFENINAKDYRPSNDFLAQKSTNTLMYTQAMKLEMLCLLGYVLFYLCVGWIFHLEGYVIGGLILVPIFAFMWFLITFCYVNLTTMLIFSTTSGVFLGVVSMLPKIFAVIFFIVGIIVLLYIVHITKRNEGKRYAS